MTRRQALLLSLGGPMAAWAQATRVSPRISWAPKPVFNGAPVLFTSESAPAEASWLGRKIDFRFDPETHLYTALAGVNLRRAQGRYPLLVDGHAHVVPVLAHSYPSGKIRVPRQFVDPPKSVRPRIAEEDEFKKRVYAASPPERLWQGPFIAPLNSRRTSPFGKRRLYNGKTRSVHMGLDFDADTGTTITAANSGRVVIARPMYFEGGLIVIDHGETIFTLYLHQSEFLVKEGTEVRKGQPIGKSGATGRVTGPHLHFAMKWQGSYLDPATLLTLWL